MDFLSNSRHGPEESITSIDKTSFLNYHPILLEGPGPSDERDAKVVASIVLYNIRRHFRTKPRVNEKPFLLITQGDPIAQKGISAISRIVAKELKIDRCLVYLDLHIDPDHYKNADRHNVKYQIKFSQLQKIMKGVSMKDYTSIVKNVNDKMKRFESEDWVKKYAFMQELTKVTLKNICGYVTVVHTVQEPMKYSVTKFFCVGVDLDLIDRECDMVNYSCELFDLFEEKRFDDVLKLLNSHHDAKVKKANVLFVDGKYGNTSLHLAAFLQAPTIILKRLFDIGGDELSIKTPNKWGSTALIDACHHKNPRLETVEFLLSKAKNIFDNDVDVLSFVCHQEQGGYTALHTCCNMNSPQPGGNPIIEKLVDYGGLRLIKSQAKNGDTPLGILYSNQSDNVDDIDYLSQQWKKFDRDLSTVPFSVLYNAKSAKYDASKDVFLQKFMNETYPTRKYIVTVMFDFYAAAAMTYCLSFGVIDLVTDTQNQDSMQFNVTSLVVLSLTWISIREAMEIWTMPFLEYILNPTNYIDIAQIGYGINALYYMNVHEQGALEGSGILMTATALAWLRIIFVTGQLSYQVSVFSAAFLQIVLRLFPFLVVSVVILAGFAHVLFIAEAQKSIENGERFTQSLLDFYVTNFLAFLSAEFIFDEDKKYDNIFVVRIMFAFVVGILLLNILIAVISNEFTEVMANSKRAFWKNRLVYLVEVNYTYYGISRFTCFRGGSKQSAEKIVAEEGKHDDTFTTDLVYKDYIERFDFLEPAFAGMKGTIFEDKFKDRQTLPVKLNRLVKVTSWFWKHWEEDDCPTFYERMITFLSFSCIDQITFPGKAAINMFLGLKIDEEAKDFVGKTVWAISYIMIVVGGLIIFPLGFFTAGLAWPRVTRRSLFAIKEKVNINDVESLMITSRRQHEYYEAQIDQLKEDLKKLKKN